MPAPSVVVCPECNTPTGPSTGTDTYLHARDCFHLDDKGPLFFLGKWARAESPEFTERVKTMMQAAYDQMKNVGGD